jgi:ATP-binding cassette, subfamily B, multidrug efflux pump
MKTFEKVAPILKRNWLKIIIGLILIIVVDLLQLTIPKIIQRSVDIMQSDNVVHSALFKPALMIFLLAISIAFIRFLWRILLIGNAWVIDRDLRQMYYEHLLLLSQNYFNKAKTGDLMAYATNDLNAVRMLMGFGLIILVDIIIFSVGAIFFMTNINLRLTLLAVTPMPLLSIIIIIFGKKIHKHFGRVQKTFASLSGKVQESISGIRVVKAFVQEEFELEKMSDSAYKYVKSNIALVRIFGIFHPFLFLIISVSMGIVLVFGGQGVLLNEISMGEFIAFFSYLGMFVWPAIAIGWLVNLYQRGTASLKRMNSIFEVMPEITDDAADDKITVLKGNIEVKDLTYGYVETTVLENISFKIKTGETLAVVGRTGCGKSTLIDLLTRVYNPPKNSIFADGNEIYKIPLNTLHTDIVMVPQDIFLFSDTIAGNIGLGNPDAEREILEDVARRAQVHEEISEFEDGFDTVIGERGVTLSGGQKQRLAIARALLTNPNVLILDDALSAVDTKTEKKILEHLTDIRKDKTTIIISHRISSIQHADKIIVIDNKTITETGSHKELLKQNGIYRDLYEKQQIKERLEENTSD